jgi:hypothetical protein
MKKLNLKNVDLKNMDGYDERQIIANNIAYKHTFWFAMGITYLNGILVMNSIIWAHPPMIFFLTFVISFTFYAVVCCIRKVGLGKNLRKAAPVATLGTAVVMLGFALKLYIIDEMVFIDEWGLTWSGGSLAVSALALIAFVCSIIDFIRDKKADREEKAGSDLLEEDSNDETT